MAASISLTAGLVASLWLQDGAGPDDRARTEVGTAVLANAGREGEPSTEAAPRGEPSTEAAPEDDAAGDATAPADEPPPDATTPADEPPADPTSPDGDPPDGEPSEGEGGFFDTETSGDATAPPMPEIEELPSRDGSSSGGAPPMPEVEELPAREGSGGDRRRGGLFDTRPPPPDREPAGIDGGSFFDPGKLEETGPSGGAIQIRGYIAANFFVTQRSNTQVRADDGTFERLSPQPFFDVSSATLYVGAPVFSDIVYARMSLEFLSIPQQTVGSQPDVLAQANRRLFFESAALEINPFTWAKRSGRWFREGFKITAGVFILPFGLEDEAHANPANWFITRPRAMTSGRVYPGTWTDVGVWLKWKPTFREQSPIRPIEIDVGMVNGDACTQTRFYDDLYLPALTPPRCARVRREGEVPMAAGELPDALPINSGFFGVAPDNNHNKSVVARLQAFPLPSINFGGSFVWGKHPEIATPAPGETTAELGQAGTWRAGGHLDLNFEEMFDSEKVPLPQLRGEVVYGVDEAIDETLTADRRMLGGYAQIAQPLFRRKKTRLPGLILQYRFDHADPSLDTPGTVNGVPVLSDFGDLLHRGESTLQSHTVGLRFPVLPRFMIKAEYTLTREDGGARNQVANDLFGLEVVADF